jgi:hypothetical protein
LDVLFQTLTARHFEEGLHPEKEPSTDGLLAPEVLENIRTTAPSTAAYAVRLVSVWPHYFRGFLAVEAPVNLSGQLVVIYGRNSMGKTSLAEALEWLFTGTLARRAMGELGNSRELEGCIGNQFRPQGAATWVEATFSVGDGTEVVLRRLLIEDFSSAKNARCKSILYCDGEVLDEREAEALLARLFGGVAPLLMQHTLRTFVHSSPAARRDYFERLLHLNDLTHLIEKAVVGDARLREFPSANGSVALRTWTAIRGMSPAGQVRKHLHRLERCANDQLRANIEAVLMEIASAEFTALVAGHSGLPATVTALKREQQRARQRSFSQLSVLRPKRGFDESVNAELDASSRGVLIDNLIEAGRKLATARTAAALVGESQLAVAQAFSLLQGVGLIDPDEARQTCPLCEGSPESLLGARVASVRTWEPVRAAVAMAEDNARKAASALKAELRSMWKLRSDLLPKKPDNTTWVEAIQNAAPIVRDAALRAHGRLTSSLDELAAFDSSVITLGRALATDAIADQVFAILEKSRADIEHGAGTIPELTGVYRRAFAELESAVGVQAKDDPVYARRETWLGAATSIEVIIVDLRWERAKVAAQESLRRAREALMTVRQTVLEARRTAFSEGMTEVWRTLRQDKGSSFSTLLIPPPRGRGFPVEIEVKARLNGPNGAKEVDALRVFSESQVHVLGIAAFVTRSKLIGHRILIFDDPVQSMDEDHFRTFAGPFLRHLLEHGYQVIVLTHNQTFDRDLSFQHYDFEGYVTMRVTHTRKYGCRVEEGNRRVTERLDLAERKMGEGDSAGAWILVRRALERLYTVVQCKYGPKGFDPLSWIKHSAENMWDEGAGAIVTAKAPNAGQRLKLILEMTAGEAHDGEQAGETDLLSSVSFLRELLSILRVGG